VEQQSQSAFIQEGIDHSITLERRPSEDPKRARFRLQISRQEDPANLVSTVTFTLPIDAIPRGAPAIRCEGDLARWNTRIGQVQILGLLDRDRILRSWNQGGGP
jgi:hypothetical protein